MMVFPRASDCSSRSTIKPKAADGPSTPTLFQTIPSVITPTRETVLSMRDYRGGQAPAVPGVRSPRVCWVEADNEDGPSKSAWR
jgi:hypothetical protein